MKISTSSLRVTEAAAARGLQIEVHNFPEGTKTAVDAAAAIGCSVAAIVKSLVFLVDDEPVVALVPGDKRLDPELLASAAGGLTVRRAGLDEVRSATGFTAGGTPPFGYSAPLRVFADFELKRHDALWAAAGTPTSVFRITVTELENVARPVWSELSR